MALTSAATKVLENTRTLVDSKESEADFDEKLELLKESVSDPCGV